jgi:hypothetical protein
MAGLALLGLSACAPPGGNQAVSTGPAARHVLREPILIEKWDLNTFGRSGCHPIGNQHVKFEVRTVDGGDLATWRREAEGVSTDCDRSAPMDNKWYYDALPEDGSRSLMVLWKNLETGAYDFAAIQYAGGRWTVTTNDGAATTLVVRRPRQFPFTTNGQRFVITVEDMEDEGAWAPNEIKWLIRR